MLSVLNELRKIRLHYRKIQMLIFPYMERMGITAIPRVMWGREDQVLMKLKSIATEVQNIVESLNLEKAFELAKKALELSNEVSELVFRENKILFPTVYALLPEGAWVAVSEISRKIGFIIDTSGYEWRSNVKPIYPYEWEPTLSPGDIDKLPEEIKSIVQTEWRPDNYVVKREGDLEFETGFLSPEEIEGIFKSLPLEVTYANVDDRVKFYSESNLVKGFVRAKTIIGRRIPFCHPPRLENYVMLNTNLVKQGGVEYREFWTKQGDRILRVIIAPVKNKVGRVLGVLEIVEDLTEIVEKPDEVKKRIVVL